MTEDVFAHVLVTRFNSPLGGDRPAASEEWLRARVTLFEKYALSSVRSQKVRPDRWLILCDSASPSWFVTEMEGLTEGFGELVWLDGPPTGLLLSRLCSRSLSPYLITTRLDNDDCVATDFIEVIQKQFRKQDMQAINFTSGLQLHDGDLYFRLDPSNAFISVIERVEQRSPVTVFIDMHDRLGAHMPLVQVKSHPMWIQVVHDSNIANTVRGVRTGGLSVATYFDVDVHINVIGGLRLALARSVGIVTLGASIMLNPHRIKKLFNTFRRTS